MESTVFAELLKGSEKVRTHTPEEGDCGRSLQPPSSGEEVKGEFVGDSGDSEFI